MNVMNEEWRALHSRCQALEGKFAELQGMARNLIRHGHDATQIGFEMVLVHRELKPLAKQRSKLCTHRIKCDAGHLSLAMRGQKMQNELTSDGLR